MARKSLSARRVTLRLEVSQAGKAALERLADETGIKQLELSTRRLEWFVEQDELTQAIVLGVYPARKLDRDLARLLAPIIARRARKRSRGTGR
jgi:hypothetical protein